MAGTPLDVINDIVTDNFARDAWDAAKTYNPEMGLLEEKGNVKEKMGGDQLYQPVEAGNYSPVSVGDYESVSDRYTPTTLHTKATFSWGQKSVFDAVSRGALMRDRGEEALVDFRNVRVPRMLRALIYQGTGSVAGALFNTQASDTQRIRGLGDVFQFDNVANTEREATITSSATYGGLSLEAGGITDVDGADSYAWTPRGYNTDFAWDGSTTGSGLIKAKFLPLFSYMQSRATFGNDPTYQPDCVIHDRNHFEIGREYVGSVEQIHIRTPDKGDKKWGLGSNVEMFYINGIPHYWSVNQGANRSDMINFDMISLCYLKPLPISMGKIPGKASGSKEEYGDRKAWVTTEVDYNLDRRGLTFEATADVQYAIHPRFQATAQDFTA